jgi:uncharacterized protein with HEPN domain
MRDDRLYLTDILDAVSQIEKYAVGGRERLDKDELVRIWSVYHIQLIGEAAQRVSEQTKGRSFSGGGGGERRFERCG